MEKGKILALNETHKLIENAKIPYTISFSINKVDKKIFEKVLKFGEIENVFGRVKQFELRVKNAKDLASALDEVRKLNPETFTVGRATLEEIFIELTGKTIGED